MKIGRITHRWHQPCRGWLGKRQENSSHNVTALDPFFRPLNTITSAILNTNSFGCRLYLGIFILFYSTNYTIQLYYLRIIYLARVLLVLPFAICASCKFGGKREKRCQRKCQNRRREDRREVRGKGEQKMIAIFWRRKQTNVRI